MKEKDGVIITVKKWVGSCVECYNSAHYKGVFKCYADKLSNKRYPAGREIDDVQCTPSWCPYRKKRRKQK